MYNILISSYKFQFCLNVFWVFAQEHTARRESSARNHETLALVLCAVSELTSTRALSVLLVVSVVSVVSVSNILSQKDQDPVIDTWRMLWFFTHSLHWGMWRMFTLAMFHTSSTWWRRALEQFPWECWTRLRRGQGRSSYVARKINLGIHEGFWVRKLCVK